ncbi:MAG: rod shape-determining protein MreC [Acidobacteriota bacterium]
MEQLINRYRNISVLILAIVAQLSLLAYQVRDAHDVRLIRVWAVSAVTPMARLLDFARSGTSGFLNNYLLLVGVQQENQRLKTEHDTLTMENRQLHAELSSADRARELAIFQQHSPQQTVAARIIGDTTGGGNSRAVILDRGASDSIADGMPLITAGGIVGRIVQVFPNAAYAMLATEQNFAAGVISQKSHVTGILKGQGGSAAVVDGIQNEQALEPGELFFTAGNDQIFPRGLLVGRVSSVRNGRAQKDVVVTLSGFENGLEEVLIVTRGVHTPVPEPPVVPQPVVLQPPVDAPPLSQEVTQPSAKGGSDSPGSPVPAPANSSQAKSKAMRSGPVSTDADRAMEAERARRHPQSKKGGGEPQDTATPVPRP